MGIGEVALSIRFAKAKVMEKYAPQDRADPNDLDVKRKWGRLIIEMLQHVKIIKYHHWVFLNVRQVR